MITLTIHNWKHRITNSGLLISSPANGDDWKERGMEEMNLPAIARNEIKNTITLYADNYPEHLVTHRQTQTQQPEFNANKAR